MVLLHILTYKGGRVAARSYIDSHGCTRRPGHSLYVKYRYNSDYMLLCTNWEWLNQPPALNWIKHSSDSLFGQSQSFPSRWAHENTEYSSNSCIQHCCSFARPRRLRAATATSIQLDRRSPLACLIILLHGVYGQPTLPANVLT